MTKKPLEKSNKSDLPFRQGVGMLILNKKKEIFLGKRIDAKANNWQMPQGGIDLGETPSMAVMREMNEEIGTDKGHIISETSAWYSYRVPEFLISKLWEGRYCGQRQKWFLIGFDGDDSDINVDTEHPEFRQWRWAKPSELFKGTTPFKHKLYSKILEEFKVYLS